jgi:Fe(3+) dicitrate transport protein
MSPGSASRAVLTARAALPLGAPLLGALLALIVAAGRADAEQEEPAAPAAPAEGGAGQPAPGGEPPLLPSEQSPGVPLESRTVGPRPVIGEAPQETLRVVPGSGASIATKDLEKVRAIVSLQDAVRLLPGVVTRPEIPSGIVANIGVRGLNPDRSERLLILEDGVPAGLAPYIENAAYYVPPFERMARLELLKGSGSILYGPHTVGGVLNLITPDIPTDGRVRGAVRAVGGSHGYLLGYAEAGQAVGRFGYLVQALGKRGDGWRENAGFDLHDLTTKFRWTFSRSTDVTVKANVYRASSQDTYLGLTTAMFQTDAYQNPVRHDRLEVDWYSGQATLRHAFNPCWELLVNAYGSVATRDWNRQDFARNTGFAPAPADTVETVGDPAVDGGAIYLRASYGARDRDFSKWGVEPRLIGTHALFGRRAETHVGVRFQQERLQDERNNRATLHSDPVTVARDVRTVNAFAAFAQERVHLTRRLALSAGLRLEAYGQARDTRIAGGLPVDVTGRTDDVEWLPGVGATYQAGRDTTLFAGLHRGFAPPRTAQAISSTGADLDLDAERAWIYELGARGRVCGWLDYETTAFYYDFLNQIVSDRESGGSSAEVVNAGRTRHVGAEVAASADLTRAMTGRDDPCRIAWFLDLSYTFVHTENLTPNGLFRGNRLPYAPLHIGSATLRVEWPSGLSLALTGQYVGEQFADQANTRAPSADGRRGVLDDRFVVDLKADWRIPRTRATVTAAIHNLFDVTYVASRAPEGIFPGMPLSGYVGLEVTF